MPVISEGDSPASAACSAASSSLAAGDVCGWDGGCGACGLVGLPVKGESILTAPLPSSGEPPSKVASPSFVAETPVATRVAAASAGLAAASLGVAPGTPAAPLAGADAEAEAAGAAAAKAAAAAAAPLPGRVGDPRGEVPWASDCNLAEGVGDRPERTDRADRPERAVAKDREDEGVFGPSPLLGAARLSGSLGSGVLSAA
mmetsp:Transcript_13950/g.30360  ORF Transcript_13950/g.30360 Transcript_13950/m.30360 type:complete len:201 (-) Transcript_13950:825-1427(-)